MLLKKIRRIPRAAEGQALVEYALILVMVAVIFGITLAATGPAIGNVFSNVIYNIVGGNPDDIPIIAEGPGLSDNFWATVEWLADNPPEEHSSVLNDPLPPPASPTQGPSPTATPITPSPTPLPTGTNTQPATPRDFQHVAPWIDTINNPEWWRVDSSVWLGSDQFFGEYFTNTQLSGTSALDLWHGELGISHPATSQINFNWPSGSGPIASGFITDNWSVRWTRQLWFAGTNPKQVSFTLNTGGGQSGARVWLYPQSGASPQNECSNVSPGGPVQAASQTYGDGQSPGGSATDCLVINGWRDNEETLSVVRTLQPETFYTLQVDFYKRTGDARVNLGIEGTTTGNRDDANLVSGTPNCAWYHSNTTKSNSSTFIWEESRTSDFPDNHVCYLELRGWVDFTALSNPKLIFWDVWDLGNANTEVWLDVAQYAPPPATLTWTRINLRGAGSNYAWTRNIIDLSTYVSGYSTKQLAMRFGMRANNGAAPRRWYVDDIEIRDFGEKTFGICAGTSETTCGNYWDMENTNFTKGNATQRIDPQFITTGRWALNGNHALGAQAWDSGPSVRNPEGGPRVHYVAFNGLIDLSGNIPDYQGDDGVPVISFHQAYDVRNGTQLEIQYTRDTPDTTPDNWQTVEVLVANPGSGGQVVQGTASRLDVLLDDIPNFDTQPFRLRFAMIVQQNADENSNWQIDNVLFHRFDAPRFSDYPFSDHAESGMDNWLPEGQWGITTDENYSREVCPICGHAFTDSPNGNYLANSNSSLILRYPLDLNYDTPENLDVADESNVQTLPANHPILSFWHKRYLQGSHEFYVEWSNNKGQTWNVIWQLNPQAVSSANFIDTSQPQSQYAWEYITVDLADIQANPAIDGGTLVDDDIILRFRLDARGGGGTNVGLFVDDIEIKDYSEQSHKLWLQEITHPTYGGGNGQRLTDDIDTPANYYDRWKLGGWTHNELIQHSGLLALTDSPPTSSGNTVTSTPRTYNVMSLNRIIDLRGITTAQNPTLYFWNRYHIGNSDMIQAQISVEDASYSPTGGDGVVDTFDYERVAGWGEWLTLWSRQAPTSTRVDTWHRAAVDLRSYAGSRIRIRFVYNTLNNDAKQDGWYIDDVIVEQRSNVPFTLPFTDNARDTGNWVTEGSWGLAPDQWRGSGGGPADLGNNFWYGVYYDCERHLQAAGQNTDQCFNYGAGNYQNSLLYDSYPSSPKPFNPAIDIEEFALDINHDFGGSGRPNGGLLDPTWDDRYAARWTRPITITTESTITFITVSDDGVRLRINGPGYPQYPAVSQSQIWNLINVWSAHGRRVDTRTVTLSPGAYELTLEWFEHTGSAVIILTAGINNFSFADSPKGGNSSSFPVIDSTRFGDSSMILNRPLDLSGTTLPVLQFYTRYQMAGAVGTVEVSTNGGFQWNVIPTSNANGFSCPSGANCNATVSGTYSGWNDLSNWQLRQLNLSPYVPNGLVHLRFHLVTSNSVSDGWYVTDIAVGGTTAGP